MPDLTDVHRDLTEAIANDIAASTDSTDAMERVVDRLKASMPYYDWVGFYLLDGNELLLGPFRGKVTPHTRIPLGRGICGMAAVEETTIIVDDVNVDPRYLACSVDTQSEIVVPIILGKDVLGAIDIDSDRKAAFGQIDKVLLERIAALLAEKLGRER